MTPKYNIGDTVYFEDSWYCSSRVGKGEIVEIQIRPTEIKYGIKNKEGHSTALYEKDVYDSPDYLIKRLIETEEKIHQNKINEILKIYTEK